MRQCSEMKIVILNLLFQRSVVADLTTVTTQSNYVYSRNEPDLILMFAYQGIDFYRVEDQVSYG